MVDKYLKMPLTIEDQFHRYVEDPRHTERHEVLWHAWKQNKRWLVQLLEGTRDAAPTFSRHDETHAQTVLHNIELILGEDRIKTLSASDCFILLHTVYIHDIGMIMVSSEQKSLIQSEKFEEMLDEIENGGDEELKRDVATLKQREYYCHNEDPGVNRKRLYLDKLEVHNAVVRLLTSYRRKEHAVASSNILMEWTKRGDRLGSGFSLAGIPQRIFLTIADCAKLHTEDGIGGIMELPQEDDGYVVDYMHPRFVSVLLQIGDLLDIDNDRFHPLVIANMEVAPESSKMHYQKHLAIRRLYICPDIIEIAAECDSQRALRLIRQEGDMLQDILRQAGYVWSSICPRDFPGSLPNVKRFDLRLKGKTIPQELVTTKFEISQKRAFEILEGANLYANKFVFLREFLQNAIDATKIQYWKECIGNAEFYNRARIAHFNSPYDLEKYVSTRSFPIEIEMEICKRDKNMKVTAVADKDVEALDKNCRKEYVYGVNVKIKDFGIGIDEATIRSIADVGRSTTRKSKIISDMPKWLRPTAEFGVGLQSAFLVTDTFKCYTHTRTEERYWITFGSGALTAYSGYINVEPANDFENKKEEDTYGTCFEVFVPEGRKMLHEECQESWNGEDVFSDKYEERRPLRHAVEMMSQMALYLDSLLGETLFPVHLTLKSLPEVQMPVNTNNQNKIRSMRLSKIQRG